jgi:hypothetical protein
MCGKRSLLGLHDRASKYGAAEELEREPLVTDLSLVAGFRTASEGLRFGGGG